MCQKVSKQLRQYKIDTYCNMLLQYNIIIFASDTKGPTTQMTWKDSYDRWKVLANGFLQDGTER